MCFFAYFSYVVQEAAGRAYGPWAPSLVTGSVSFCFIRDILFSIYVILNFSVYASANDDALDSLSFLKVALES